MIPWAVAFELWVNPASVRFGDKVCGAGVGFVSNSLRADRGGSGRTESSWRSQMSSRSAARIGTAGRAGKIQRARARKPEARA